MIQKPCQRCGKPLMADLCPHCLASDRRRHGRLVELRDEVRDVSSRISAQMSGLPAPPDVLEKLWSVIYILSDVHSRLRAETRPDTGLATDDRGGITWIEPDESAE